MARLARVEIRSLAEKIQMITLVSSNSGSLTRSPLIPPRSVKVIGYGKLPIPKLIR